LLSKLISLAYARERADYSVGASLVLGRLGASAGSILSTVRWVRPQPTPSPALEPRADPIIRSNNRGGVASAWKLPGGGHAWATWVCLETAWKLPGNCLQTAWVQEELNRA